MRTARAAVVLLAAGFAGLSAEAEAQGAAGWALRFYGNGIGDIDRVKISIDAPPRPADVGVGDFTIEFWMKALLSENGSGPCTTGGDAWINGNIAFDRDVYGPGDWGDWGISLYGGRISYGVASDTNGNSICGAAMVADGLWHHVAVTRRVSDGQLRVFVDGTPDATGPGPTGDVSYRDDRGTPFPNDPFLVIGAEKHDAGPAYPSYSGCIDEVRLSTTLRYTGPFTPPSAPFVTDAATAALYHLDEGAGNLVGDSSGGRGPEPRRAPVRWNSARARMGRIDRAPTRGAAALHRRVSRGYPTRPGTSSVEPGGLPRPYRYSSMYVQCESD